MAPLLNDVGLLSSYANNQNSSSQAIDKIISMSHNPKSIINDTLVGNPGWINCFSKNDVHDEARNI